MANTTDYTGLITSEHAGRPKYSAMVGAVTQGLVDLQNFLGSLVTEFDVDSARWTQLDKIGVRVGLDRNLRTSVPGIYAPSHSAGVVPLADSDYQVLLHGKIGANQWDGTISGAYSKLLNAFAASGSYLFMIDNQDMSVTIAVAGAVPSDGFKAALSGGYMQIRPAGVQATYLYPTAPGGALFGFDVSNSLIQGFDAGVWASPT